MSVGEKRNDDEANEMIKQERWIIASITLWLSFIMSEFSNYEVRERKKKSPSLLTEIILHWYDNNLCD